MECICLGLQYGFAGCGRPYLCAAYVVDYVNKSNRGISNLHQVLVQIKMDNPNLDINNLLRRLGVKMLDAVEICSQEAAWTIFRLAMSEVSRKVTFIPTMPPAERTRVRKSIADMDTHNVAPASTDVWKLNAIQK